MTGQTKPYPQGCAVLGLWTAPNGSVVGISSGHRYSPPPINPFDSQEERYVHQ
jgi:hypothetical protein